MRYSSSSSDSGHASSAASAAAAHPLRAQRRHGNLLVEFLRRALLYRAPNESPQDVAGLLASYAREARARMDAAESNLDAFKGLRKTLSEGLGLQFDGDKGEHFLRPTLWHWRNQGGREVDMLAECGRRLVAIEVKAAATLDAGDLKNLRWFATQGPGCNRNVTGLVFYLGDQVLTFGDRLFGLPLSIFWAWPPT